LRFAGAKVIKKVHSSQFTVHNLLVFSVY